MLTEFTTWLFQLIKDIFTACWDFVIDAFINLLDLVLGAIVSLLSLIPVPQWLSGGLMSLWSQLDPGIVYIVSQLGLVVALAMIGSGYLFRLVRKVVTVFQW